MHEDASPPQSSICEIFMYGRTPTSAQLVRDHVEKFSEEPVRLGDISLVVTPFSVVGVDTFNRDILPSFLIPQLPIISLHSERRRVGVYVGDDVSGVANIRRSYTFPSRYVSSYSVFLEQIIGTLLNEISLDSSFGRW